jgi:hypothetical protein
MSTITGSSNIGGKLLLFILINRVICYKKERWTIILISIKLSEKINLK